MLVLRVEAITSETFRSLKMRVKIAPRFENVLGELITEYYINRGIVKHDFEAQLGQGSSYEF